LNKYIEYRNSFLEENNISNFEYLWVNKYSKNIRLSYKGIQNMVNSTLNKANIEDKSPHSLRHTALSNAVQNGVDLRTVQDIAGHSSITTTQRYMHVLNEGKKNFANAMNNVSRNFGAIVTG
jgi:integrase/recombinase XerC